MATTETFTEIGHRLWARYGDEGLEILRGNTPNEPDEDAVAITVPHGSVPYLLGKIRATAPVDPADTALALAIRMLADRVAVLEETTRKHREDFSNRLGALDVRVGDDHRAHNVAEEAIRNQVDQRYTAMRALVADLDRAHLEARGAEREREHEESPAVHDLAQTVTGLLDTVESLQETVARLSSATSAIAAAAQVPADVATKDYVDTAIRRLNGALRDHVGRFVAQAVRAAAPGPGLLKRVVDAVRAAPGMAEPAAQATATWKSIDQATAIAAAAAQKAGQP